MSRGRNYQYSLFYSLSLCALMACSENSSGTSASSENNPSSESNSQNQVNNNTGGIGSNSNGTENTATQTGNSSASPKFFSNSYAPSGLTFSHSGVSGAIPTSAGDLIITPVDDGNGNFTSQISLNGQDARYDRLEYQSISNLVNSWRKGIIVDGKLGDQPLASYIVSGVDMNSDGTNDFLTFVPDSNFYNLNYINAIATDFIGSTVTITPLDFANGNITINGVAYDVFGHDGNQLITAAQGNDGVIIIASGSGASSGTLGARITLSNGTYNPVTGNFSGNASFDNMLGSFVAAGGVTPTSNSQFMSGIVYGSTNGVFSGGFLGANVPKFASE